MMPYKVAEMLSGSTKLDGRLLGPAAIVHKGAPSNRSVLFHHVTLPELLAPVLHLGGKIVQTYVQTCCRGRTFE